MALADTSKAIGAVSSLLKERIDTISGINTTIGRPSDTATPPRLNLFLYEVSFDPFLKNTPLNEGEKAPLWIVLKYLLTAFATATDSDSETAHELLGAGLRAVYTDDLLKLDPGLAVYGSLGPNPSPLHVTFEEAPSDLVAKLMQGPDDKVRLSASFQVRPVMIAAAEPGDFSLLVGIDYSAPVSPTFSDPYLGLDVLPSMGASIEDLSPTGFELDEVVTIRGTDLHLSDLSVMLGSVELPIVMQQPDELRFKVEAAFVNGSQISAGSHPVTVVQKLSGTGKKRKSNSVIGNLVPSLDSIAIGAVFTDPVDSIDKRNITISGELLGVDADDTILACHRNGNVYKMLDDFTPNPGPPSDQTTRVVKFDPPDLVEIGDLLILLVNGQRAPQSPAVESIP